MSGYQRMLPRLDEENRFYWTSGADGVLRMQRCQDCRWWIHPPLPICPKCLQKNLAPEVLSGGGTVFSYTVNHKSWGNGLKVPYIIGIVSLDEQEGLQLTSNILEVSRDAIRVGMRVTVAFEKDEDVWLPMFKPEHDGGAA